MTISEFKEASQKILSLESLDPLITVNALKKIQKLFIEYRTDAITVADPVIAEHKIKLVKGLNEYLMHRDLPIRTKGSGCF